MNRLCSMIAQNSKIREGCHQSSSPKRLPILTISMPLILALDCIKIWINRPDGEHINFRISKSAKHEMLTAYHRIVWSNTLSILCTTVHWIDLGERKTLFDYLLGTKKTYKTTPWRWTKIEKCIFSLFLEASNNGVHIPVPFCLHRSNHPGLQVDL